MSEQQYRKKLEGIRKEMFKSTSIDLNTAQAASDWIDGQVAELEKEKNRPGRRSSLRVRLGNLVVLILTQTVGLVKRNA